MDFLYLSKFCSYFLSSVIAAESNNYYPSELIHDQICSPEHGYFCESRGNRRARPLGGGDLGVARDPQV